MQPKYFIDDNDPDIKLLLETHPELTPDIVFEEVGNEVLLKRQFIQIYSRSKTSRLNEFFNLDLLSKYLEYLHVESVKKSRLQGKGPETLVSFSLSLFSGDEGAIKLTGEAKDLHDKFLTEMQSCDSKHKLTTDDSYLGEDNAITKYAETLSGLLIKFVESVSETSGINVSDVDERNKILKSHFARALFIEPALRLLKKIKSKEIYSNLEEGLDFLLVMSDSDEEPNKAYITHSIYHDIDRRGFISLVFAVAAYQVLDSVTQQLISERSCIMSPDDFFISFEKDNSFGDSRITNRAVRLIPRNLYLKLVIYYLEGNWDIVSEIYGTPEKPFKYTLKNLLIVLSDICDEAFDLDVRPKKQNSSGTNGKGIEEYDEEIVMRARLHKIIGGKGPLLSEARPKPKPEAPEDTGAPSEVK